MVPAHNVWVGKTRNSPRRHGNTEPPLLGSYGEPGRRLRGFVPACVWGVSIATGVLVASGHESTQRCWEEKRRRQGHDGGRPDGADHRGRDRGPQALGTRLVRRGLRSCSQAGHQTDGLVSVSLLFLPLQAVRANLRLATQAVQPYMATSGDSQSLICANLLAWLFHSVLPCLRGESSCTPLRVLFAASVPGGTLPASRVRHVQAVGNQYATLCRHSLRTHRFC